MRQLVSIIPKWQIDFFKKMEKKSDSIDLKL
jgi:hypothetical protein